MVLNIRLILAFILKNAFTILENVPWDYTFLNFANLTSLNNLINLYNLGNLANLTKELYFAGSVSSSPSLPYLKLIIIL